MKVSTRGHYATRAMLDLAAHYGRGPVLIRDIADRQGVSSRYLEQLMMPLKAAGLVRVARGARGGFALARQPSEIRLLDIITVMEGSTAPVECVDDPGVCSQSDACLTRQVWTDMKAAADRVLRSTTLQDLLQRQGEPARGIPCI
ncbi:MAG: Rrf2 family transcriptional regulator [Dehalococcoidia bacterium]|nr:Rrf2 family transcriptional regulator [Dehalococcoidia bacterium]